MNHETVFDFQWDTTKAPYNARKHDVTFDLVREGRPWHL
jgi:uncharacterized DUF497 family protein